MGVKVGGAGRSIGGRRWYDIECGRAAAGGSSPLDVGASGVGHKQNAHRGKSVGEILEARGGLSAVGDGMTSNGAAQRQAVRVRPTSERAAWAINKTPTGVNRWAKFWRRGAESNRRIELLQSSALPLGYRAVVRERRTLQTIRGACKSGKRFPAGPRSLRLKPTRARA